MLRTPAPYDYFNTSALYPPSSFGNPLKQYAFVKSPPFNATGDGIADDLAAITAAVATGNIVVFESGTYYISNSLNVANAIFLPGAIVKPANTKTFTLTGKLYEAPLAKIFDTSLGGICAVAAYSDIWAHPEYWGAIPNDGSGAQKAINRTAIQACFDNAYNILFMRDDYFISNDVRIKGSQRTVIGGGNRYDGLTRGTATRLIVDGGINNCLIIGPDAWPGSINACPDGVTVRDIFCTRDAAPNQDNEPTGVILRWSKYAKLYNVSGVEHVYGIRIYGTIYCKLFDCIGFRSVAGSGAGADRSTCMFVDGSTDIAAGGNASLYIYRPALGNQGAADAIANSICLRIYGQYTDTFCTDVETIGGSVGIEVDATGAQDNDNRDCKIVNPVVDQHYVAGMYLKNINAAGSIALVEPYAGMKAGAIACIFITGNAGVINIKGGQLIASGDATTRGIDATGGIVNIENPIIQESGNAAVSLSNVLNSDIRVVAENRTATCSRVVQLVAGCDGNIISASAAGTIGKVAEGVRSLDATSNGNNIDWTRTPATYVGVNNRFIENGVSILAVGNTAGGNTVSGI